MLVTLEIRHQLAPALFAAGARARVALDSKAARPIAPAPRRSSACAETLPGRSPLCCRWQRDPRSGRLEARWLIDHSVRQVL
jgi:hypothetical protein